MPEIKSLAAIALIAGWAFAGPAAAQGNSIVMKLSTATVNDAQHQFMKDFGARVEKDSGGRIKAEIYPNSQLGSIPRQIEGTQFGAIQGWIGPPEFLVGLDERFEVMTAPGLIANTDQAQRLTQDPELSNFILSMGANKGLMGVAFFLSAPSSFATRKPVRHLADFKGLKLRVLAGDFANEQIRRLGATPVAMSLADVLPGIQQGTIDGAVAQVAVFATMQYQDAAKYITETEHNYIFTLAELSRKWFATLPPDLQKIVTADAALAGRETNPWAASFFESERKTWVATGGELIQLPPDEHAAMMAALASVGEDMSKPKPALHAAYETLVAAVARTK